MKPETKHAYQSFLFDWMKKFHSINNPEVERITLFITLCLELAQFLEWPDEDRLSVDRVEAEQHGIPSRNFKIEGMKIKVPSNAVLLGDGSLRYHGHWDGSFKLAASSDLSWVIRSWLNTPAFIFMVIDGKRYDRPVGVGGYWTEPIDDREFYDLSNLESISTTAFWLHLHQRAKIAASSALSF